MSHTCKPGHPGILADGCERCDELAAEPLVLGLDPEKTARLWNKMVSVERRREGRYETSNEGKAGHSMYLMAVWLQRHMRIDPFVDFVDLQLELSPALRAGA